jgi:hypothetical protein
VGRSAVRNALLEYGIAQPQENPFSRSFEDDANTLISEDGDMLAVSIMMKTIKIKTLLEVLLRDASG